MAKIARLKPGSTTSLRAIRRADGELAIDPEDKVSALSQHWAEVFRGKPRDEAATEH